MNKKTTAVGLVVIVLLCISTQPIFAQGDSTTPSESHVISYRLDFSINELENGRKVNTRHYSNIQTEDAKTSGLPAFQELKIGTRVPVESGANPALFQYIDIGTNISSRLYTKENALTLEVHANISNLAPPDKDIKLSQPLVRQMVIGGVTTIVPGKPVTIGSVDDPNSNHEFQLVVTVTKL